MIQTGLECHRGTLLALVHIDHILKWLLLGELHFHAYSHLQLSQQPLPKTFDPKGIILWLFSSVQMTQVKNYVRVFHIYEHILLSIMALWRLLGAQALFLSSLCRAQSMTGLMLTATLPDFVDSAFHMARIWNTGSSFSVVSSSRERSLTGSTLSMQNIHYRFHVHMHVSFSWQSSLL